MDIIMLKGAIIGAMGFAILLVCAISSYNQYRYYRERKKHEKIQPRKKNGRPMTKPSSPTFR